MNFSQMHEHLRLELLRRIQRGTLSVSLLARQTGYGQPHLSNFLGGKRQLSLEGLDRVLKAQQMTAADLVPSRPPPFEMEDLLHVPLVSHSTAMYEPQLRLAAVQKLLPVPAGLLSRAIARATVSRRAWHRFVAIQIPALDAPAMEPIVLADSVVFLDRHYNSLLQYRPARANLYAVRHDTRLKVRYADFQAGRLLLRPHNRAAPVDLLEPGPGESPGDLIVGRIVMVMNEF
ncbi:hypothetical protein [Occallatibacter riparius]|uniref:Uncharacterized protein n=1 Tax=Occallatibacter riparius TaxID=1002689 RepID=A0A9J7BPS7_9BACT|nr:hypothetical protein [Occallatibacter riparius]UWZ84712.1 hypothetical protein MOP44_01965 [Occallatibacter riparius]